MASAPRIYRALGEALGLCTWRIPIPGLAGLIGHNSGVRGLGILTIRGAVRRISRDATYKARSLLETACGPFFCGFAPALVAMMKRPP